MPTGIYERKIKWGKRVNLQCEFCKAEIVLLACIYKQRKIVKFCSQKCMGLAKRKKDTFSQMKCTQCKKEFSKRTDHMTVNNFCSRACAHSHRRKQGAKWRNEEYIKKYMQEYVQKNKEKHNARSREWGEKNKDKKLATARSRRATIKTDYISPAVWEELKKKYDFSCLSCSRKESEISLELDHIIPIVKGGRNIIENAQPLCRSCNAKKGSKIIDYRTIKIQ